jgi:hypothetical protein
MAELVRSVSEETPFGIISECQAIGREDRLFFLREVSGCHLFLGFAMPPIPILVSPIPTIIPALILMKQH